MERYLEKGYTLQMNGGGKYVITGMIGRGSSCAVYRAEHCTADGVQTEHLLKEYNPRALSITRTDDGMMCISEEEQDAFCAGLAHFRTGYEKQLGLRQTDELRNSTSNIQNIFDANGTRYIDMTLFTGSTYSDIKEKSLHELCKRMKAVTQVVGNYHKAGLLHLDIKPDNIFAIPETCELVMLFDFDSVIEKSNVAKSVGLSYTKTWAAPEQTVAAYRKKICEATDLYAIGEMMFWQIFGRHSTNEEHRSFFEYQFDTETEIFKNTNPKVFPLLSELLHHTIATSVQNRYQSADELIAALDELIKLSDPKEPYLVSTNVTAEDFFIGRDGELQQMQEMLSRDPVLFLCGMGGIGKSELARNYVKQHRNDYDTVFFATYLSSWSMLLADDYNIQIANFRPYDGEKPEDYFARKLRKLKELCDERTLFVIDNVNEDEYDESENECFRQIMSLPCRFLFTSRLHEWNHPMLEVGKLSDHSDLVALFDKWCPIKNEEQMNAVNEIIDYVDSHTLTLELIAKQTSAAFSTPAKMLARLHEHGMKDSGKEKVKSDKDLAVSKKTAFEHVCDLFDMADLTDGEKYVMANMALIPSTGIEASLFMEWCELGGADDINSLIAKGWIDRDEEIISLHPIVAEVSLNYHYDFELGDTVMLKNAKEYLTENYLTFSPNEKKKYADFSMEMMRVLMASGLCSENTGIFLRDVSDKYSAFASLNQVIEAQKCALDTFREIYGEENAEVANSLHNLGEQYGESGDLSEALRFMEKALSIRKKLLGEECHDVADTLNSLGILYYYWGNLEKAMQLSKQALLICEKLFGKSHDDVADALDCIGVFCHENGDFDEALRYYEHALSIRKKLFGEDHPNTATSFNNLGVFYNDKGDFDIALRYYKRALSIRRKAFGEYHSEVAISLSNLGTLYDDIGEYDEALQCFEQALAIRKKLFGEEHPDMASLFGNIGTLYSNKGDLGTALYYREKSLYIFKRIFGDEHIDTASSYYRLGCVYKKMGEVEAAKEYVEKAYQICRNIKGDDDSKVKTMKDTLDEILKQAK